MKSNKEYQIPYLGLKLGNHQYQFMLTGEFFEKFEFSEIQHADIEVNVELEKQSTMLIFNIRLEGVVQTICDRCGDDLDIPIAIGEQLIVKFGDATGSLEDEILVHGPSEYALDLAHYMYEYAHLALPQRHVHESQEECNQETLKELEKHRADTAANTQWAELKNLNYEDPEDRDMDETDLFDEEDED